MMPLERIGFNKGKGKDKSEPVWPIESVEAHEIKSCDTGTLRYRADIPSNERSGAPVVIAPSHRSCAMSMGQDHPQWRMVGHRHGLGEHRLGLMLVHRVEPRSWLLGRQQGMDLQSR